MQRLTVCCGVSGSGKSSLVRGILLRGVKESIAANKRSLRNQDFRITNGNTFHRAIEVTQKPIGKTPRSTPATYLGVWDKIRSMISSLPEAKAKGFCPSDFSFNVKGGRCEVCKGAGKIKMEMNFLSNQLQSSRRTKNKKLLNCIREQAYWPTPVLAVQPAPPYPSAGQRLERGRSQTISLSQKRASGSP